MRRRLITSTRYGQGETPRLRQVSIALIVIIIAQAKGQGGLGGIFGGDSTVYRTRRGVEKTMFNVTVGLALAFFVISLVSVLVI